MAHAFTTSGGPIPAALRIFAFSLAFGYESLLLSLRRSECPECLDPFPLCLAFPDSLVGRDSHEYYGSAAPTRALVTYPPIHVGSSCRFRRCSPSNFSVNRSLTMSHSTSGPRDPAKPFCCRCQVGSLQS